MSAGVINTLKTFKELQTRLNLHQATSEHFFDEWLTDLPALNESEQLGIARIKNRYDYHRLDGLLLEGIINWIVVSPLLELAGFLDPPFQLKSPYGIGLELDDPQETIRGLIDTLVIQEQLWILVVESKRTSVPVPAALPQLLTYMMANPHPERPTYGLATKKPSSRGHTKRTCIGYNRFTGMPRKLKSYTYSKIERNPCLES
jgi:hypothetical protein